MVCPNMVAVSICVAVILAGNLKFASAETVEACMLDNFHAQCARGHVIVVTSAEFGRMRVGRCITENEFIGCTNDVHTAMDRRCSGRQSCQFDVDELETENTECLKSLMKFLEVTYTCIKVEATCTSNGPNTLTTSHGHLSNQISCGSPKPHWIIRAQVGQIINMSLIDFAASGKVESFITCKYVYGYILERALGINHTICGGKQREGALYSSKTNSVEIHLVSSNTIGQSFLVGYEVNGCPDLTRPPNAWYKREGSEAVIGCETNDQEWRLTCTGNTWHGTVGNCSEPRKIPVVSQSKDQKKPLTMSSIVMMTGFAGGALVIIVVVIVIAAVYLQKYRMRKETQQLERTYATMGRNVHNPKMSAQLDPRVSRPGQLTNQREADRMTSYPTQWACTTLPASSANTDPLIELSDEKEGLYNSLK